eukprot:gene10447-1895_t
MDGRPPVLVLAPTTTATGNATTVGRIRGAVEISGCVPYVVSCTTTTPVSLVDLLSKTRFAAMVCLHAFHCGSLLLRLESTILPPVVLVFGGTDINEMIKAAPRLAIINAMVQLSARVICFSACLKERASLLWPAARAKWVVIPQGVFCPSVDPPTASNSSGSTFLMAMGLPQDAKFFLLPAGLRLVKDPLFLAGVVADLHREDPSVFMVIMGEALDQDVAAQVKAASSSSATSDNCNGLLYRGALCQGDLHQVMALPQCVAVVNTSKSEGQPQTILEAMQCGKVVMVRNVEGNTAVVQHSITGLVFTTPGVWFYQAKFLLDGTNDQSVLIGASRDYIANTHSLCEEAKRYQCVLQDVIEHQIVSAAVPGGVPDE